MSFENFTVVSHSININFNSCHILNLSWKLKKWPIVFLLSTLFDSIYQLSFYLFFLRKFNNISINSIRIKFFNIWYQILVIHVCHSDCFWNFIDDNVFGEWIKCFWICANKDTFNDIFLSQKTIIYWLPPTGTYPINSQNAILNWLCCLSDNW